MGTVVVECYDLLANYVIMY